MNCGKGEHQRIKSTFIWFIYLDQLNWSCFGTNIWDGRNQTRSNHWLRWFSLVPNKTKFTVTTMFFHEGTFHSSPSHCDHCPTSSSKRWLSPSWWSLSARFVVGSYLFVLRPSQLCPTGPGRANDCCGTPLLLRWRHVSNVHIALLKY